MRQILKDKSFQIAIMLTLIFLGTGIFFLFFGLAELNLILFGILPVTLGISIGALPNKKWALVGAFIASLFVLYGLFTIGLAGFICVFYSIPIVISLIFLGSVITYLIKRYRKIKNDKFYILLLPLILFVILAPIEKNLNSNNKQLIEVKTERVFNFTPEQVYDAIKAVDTLDAQKPFLMNFDLPVPTKCVLEKEKVGGLRTCYFKGGNLSKNEYGGGTIVERITELERGKILKMDVIDCNLIGRKWLGFKEAIYYFEKIGNHNCKLIRVTVYTSVLSPRIYWEPLERLGIEQEHDYVFNNLDKDLKNKYGSFN